MKHLLTAILIALCSFNSHALRRIDMATPVLHSVFDKDTPENAGPPKPYTAGENKWSRRVALKQAGMPNYIRKYEAPSFEIRRRGIKLTVAGGTAFTGGAAAILYTFSENGRQIKSPVYGYSALTMIIVGAIMTLIGVPMWLSHL